MVATGDVLTSPSGRTMSPVPKVDATSDRKTQNTMRRVDQWMHNEAVAEASATGNEYLGTLLDAMNPKRLSQSDRDSLNDILYS